MARLFQPGGNKTKSRTQRKTVTIHALSHKGEGIASDGEHTHFVAGALPGEQATVELGGKGGNIVLKQITQPSPQRVAPVCPVYQQCGGCQLQHLSHDGQLHYKQDNLIRNLQQQGIDLAATTILPAMASQPFSYRRAARLAIYHNPKHQITRLGFRARQDKQIVEVDHCPVLVESLNSLLPPLQQLLPMLTGVRHIGHIELLQLPGASPVVMLREVTPLTAEDLALLQQFASQHNCQIWRDNGHQRTALTASQSYQHAGYDLPLDPGHFFQANDAINAQLVARIADWLGGAKDNQTIEWFAGNGNFSIPLALAGLKVHAVELNGAMTNALAASAKALDLPQLTSETADLEEPLNWRYWQRLAPTAALLDPPRAGAKRLCEEINKLPSVQRVVYVSCNPGTLARDAAQLQAQGLALAELQLVDMYPQSYHSECIGLFVRG